MHDHCWVKFGLEILNVFHIVDWTFESLTSNERNRNNQQKNKTPIWKLTKQYKNSRCKLQPECSKLFPFALSQLHPWSAQITGKITKETFILEIAKHFLILNQKSKFRFVRKSCTDWKCLNTPIVDFPESLFLESSTDYHPSKRIMAMLTNIYQFHNMNGYF